MKCSDIQLWGSVESNRISAEVVQLWNSTFNGAEQHMHVAQPDPTLRSFVTVLGSTRSACGLSVSNRWLCVLLLCVASTDQSTILVVWFACGQLVACLLVCVSSCV